jgi:hypothetical protein
MATSPRSKVKTGRAAPVHEQPAATPDAILAAIFADLPESAASTSVPDVVRLNRRARARRRLVDALEARGPYPVPEARVAEAQRTAERWAQKGFAADFAEVDAFEIRCAEEREVLDAAARGDEKGRFEAAERGHRREVERRYGWIEIRGLQLSARVYQDLEIAFVPLHVEDASEVAAPKKKASAKGKGKRGGKKADVEAMLAMVRAMERPRVPATRAMTKHPRLLIVGGPGSGKSTLIAHVATRAVRAKEEGEDAWLKDALPFVLPVRSLREGAVTVEMLAGMAGAEAWFFRAALESGRALLLVDGLDEAKADRVAELAAAMSKLLDLHTGTRVVATTRPTSGVWLEAAPAGFAQAKLTAMTRGEVYTYIDRWCLAAELSLGKAHEQAEADAKAAADDLKERVRLRSAIEKLAQTPLMCSVICVVHRFLGERIPERRVVLYEAITNALLYEWDRAKFPEKAVIGQLDAQQKRSLLSKLARAMHEERVVELPEDKVVASFAGQLPALGRKAEEAGAIVAEIRDRAGVLVERSPKVFGFSHLTFQEYLTAMEVVNRKEYEGLLERYEDEWWHEVVVLAAGFPWADAAWLVRGLLARDGDKVGVGTMLAAQCAETAIELPADVRTKIELKAEKLVPPQNESQVLELAKLGEIAGPVLLSKLAGANAEGKAAIARTFWFLCYEPAVGALRKLMRDTTPVYGTYRKPLPLGMLVGVSLAQMAAKSDLALAAIAEEASAPGAAWGKGALRRLVDAIVGARLAGAPLNVVPSWSERTG